MIPDGVTWITYLALWIIVLIQTIVIFEMLRQIGILRRRMPAEPGALLTDEGLPRGALAPPLVSLEVHTGQRVEISPVSDSGTLLIFFAPNCAGCHALAAELAPFAKEHLLDTRVIAICPSTSDACDQFAREHALAIPLLVDDDQAICRAFHVLRTPSATLIDANGRVRIHGIPNSLDHLEGLIREEGIPSAHRQWIREEEMGMEGNVPR